MLEAPKSLNRIDVSVVFLTLHCLTSVPVLAQGEDKPPSLVEAGFTTPDRLPPARSEGTLERIADYEDALALISSPNPAKERQKRFSPSGFPDIVVDLSTVWDPDDAITAAHKLAGRIENPQIYEQAGIALLMSARQARFDQDLDLARRHLRTAALVFDLAGRHSEGGAEKKGPLYRAMVHLEEILVTDSRDPWPEAAAFLAEQTRTARGSAPARWAQRILDDPAQYVGEDEIDTETKYYVGDDIRPPVKVFAPQLRLTEIARRARVQGVIILQTVIDRHGTVAGIKVLKGLPMGLEEEAVRTLSTWLFEPATLHREPVSVYYNLTMNVYLR